MNLTLSVFLDLVRVLAAVGVFLAHGELKGFIRAGFTTDFAHSCVMVFFVLSGFVIAHTTFQKRRGPEEYVLARLSRLSSVVIPALLLTGAIDFVISRANPEFWAGHTRGHEPLRFVLSFFYLQCVWFSFTEPPTNGPLWSLAYEFWYYVFFGIVTFVRPNWLRIACVIGLAFALGPQILVLFPVWLMGVAVYFLISRWKPPVVLSTIGFAVCSVAFCYTIIHPLPNPLPFRMGMPPLYFSANFLPDYVSGLLFSFIIIFVSAWNLFIAAPIIRAVRSFSDLTFSLYLYHYPLIILACALFPDRQSNSLREIALLAACLGMALLLGVITEHRRGWWKRIIQSGIDWMKRFAPRTAPRNQVSPKVL